MKTTKKHIIWTNDDYDEWKDSLVNDKEYMEQNGYTEDDIDYQLYHLDKNFELDDELYNLDKDVDGVIVCFASLGLWNGRRNGAAIIGSNVNNILHTDCDIVTWYCDRFNVRCDAIHHDGTNHYLYRVAKNRDHAEQLANKIAYEDMTEQQFMKATKSLRPYVANVYGW